MVVLNLEKDFLPKYCLCQLVMGLPENRHGWGRFKGTKVNKCHALSAFIFSPARK